MSVGDDARRLASEAVTHRGDELVVRGERKGDVVLVGVSVTQQGLRQPLPYLPQLLGGAHGGGGDETLKGVGGDGKRRTCRCVRHTVAPAPPTAPGGHTGGWAGAGGRGWEA